MAAMRCSSCSLNCPVRVRRCPICAGELWHANNTEPDSDYEARVREARNPPTSDPTKPAVWTPPGIHPSRVVEHGGQEWISKTDLEACGYYECVVGDILRVQTEDEDTFYEIDGPATYTQTLGTQEGWWIRPVRVEVPNAPPEA